MERQESRRDLHALTDRCHRPETTTQESREPTQAELYPTAEDMTAMAMVVRLVLLLWSLATKPQT